MDKALPFAGGMAIGAGLMFLLDPGQGNRRRKLLRDRAARMARRSERAFGKARRDLDHRAQGLAARVNGRLHPRPVADDVLVERVRSQLGRLVSHPHAVRVEASGGVVTLAGPVLARELPGLLRGVSRVVGVREVANQLDVHRTAGRTPSLQGGSPPARARFELLQRNWSPAARFVTAFAGGLVAVDAVRRGRGGIPLGLAASAVIARAIANRPLTGRGARSRRRVDVARNGATGRVRQGAPASRRRPPQPVAAAW